MKNITKNLANHFKGKHKQHDYNKNHKKIKREVLSNVQRKVLPTPLSEIEEKGKFFKSVKKILLDLRVKDTFLSVKNNPYIEKLTSRFKITQSQEVQENEQDLDRPVEILHNGEDCTSKTISLYMPLQF